MPPRIMTQVCKALNKMNSIGGKNQQKYTHAMLAAFLSLTTLSYFLIIVFVPSNMSSTKMLSFQCPVMMVKIRERPQKLIQAILGNRHETTRHAAKQQHTRKPKISRVT